MTISAVYSRLGFLKFSLQANPSPGLPGHQIPCYCCAAPRFPRGRARPLFCSFSLNNAYKSTASSGTIPNDFDEVYHLLFLRVSSAPQRMRNARLMCG